MSTTCSSCGALLPSRLTATPSGVTVWVQEPYVEAKIPEHEVWLRGTQRCDNPGAVESSRSDWVCLTRHEWFTLRDTVDKYLATLADQ